MELTAKIIRFKNFSFFFLNSRAEIKVNSVQNNYENYKRLCGILATLQNWKNLSQL